MIVSMMLNMSSMYACNGTLAIATYSLLLYILSEKFRNTYFDYLSDSIHAFYECFVFPYAFESEVCEYNIYYRKCE